MKARFSVRRLLASTLACAALLALVELGLRLGGFEHLPPEGGPITMWTPLEDTALNQGRALHEWDTDAIWVTRAGAAIPAKILRGDHSQTINANGFRGPEVPLEKSAELRVATLGDSSTFGYGVLWEHTYSARLPEVLAAGGIESDVVCGGVVGYTIRQGIERYKKHVRPYGPDVVVAAFGAINEHFSAGPADRVKIARLRDRSGPLSRFAKGARRFSRLLQLGAWIVRSRPGTGTGDGAGARNANLSEFTGTRRVSVDVFGRDLAELAREVEEDGARLIVVSMPRRPSAEKDKPVLLDYTARLEEVVRAEGLWYVDLHSEFRTLDGDGADLFLEGDPVHPSPPGHVLAAERIGERILEMLASPGRTRAQ